ncbi:DUF3530 family protein [Alteromonas sp. a30]|nr:DUF3530 family protein [Alteromonas sp. a30]
MSSVAFAQEAEDTQTEQDTSSASSTESSSPPNATSDATSTSPTEDLSQRNPRLDLPPPSVIELAKQQNNDIKRYMDADHYRKFEINGVEQLLVISESHTALTKGVAVIVAETGTNSLSRHALAELVKPLNATGWVTVLLPAPTFAFEPIKGKNLNPEKIPPTLEDKATTKQPFPFEDREQIPDSDFTTHESHMTELMERVVEVSNNYPGFFLVVAQGTSAAWLSKIYAEQTISQPDALVAISPYWPDYRYNKQLPKWLARVPAPVLDIYNSWDNAWIKKTAPQRVIEAEKALKLHYRQREIVGQPYDKQQFLYVAKEIYGWLTHMGW